MPWKRSFVFAFVSCLLLTNAPVQAEARLGIYPMPETIAVIAGLDPQAATVYYVVPVSPAGKAGLQTGDVITAFDGEKVGSFDELAEKVGASQPGQDVQLQLQREGTPRTITAKLSAVTGALTPSAYQATLDYLKKLREKDDALSLRLAIIENMWNANQRNATVAQIENDLKDYPRNRDLLYNWLEYLQKTGRYEEYVTKALELSEQQPGDLTFLIHRIEALLGTNRLAEAEKSAVLLCGRLNRQSWSGASVNALSMWSLSRLRQGKPLSGADVPAIVANGPWDNEGLDIFRFWQEQLAGKSPYQLQQTDGSDRVEFVKSQVLLGLVPNKMHGIPITVNGVEVPLAIVDTGASHTLLSTQTAKAAGVKISESSRSASGSLPFTSRAGYVEEMRIGNLILKNVPVNVGNPPPLIMTNAKAALGVDLMHHIRFTLEYHNSKVRVERADKTFDNIPDANNVWDIPLWTFSDHCLARLRTQEGKYARALIDSGNFAQTLIWPVWSEENLQTGSAGGSSQSMLDSTNTMISYMLSDRNRKVTGLTLAGKELPAWYGMDMPPVTLNGVDLLDFLMGHDLLSQYVVTVDMTGRRLRLQSPGGTFQPPKSVPPRGIFGL